ncbi:TRAP transporter small permease [Roseobacter sp. HKCCA0434]|uniref:TRAP transporter small permease n=1 Tax=Roseobacter sp. HKCCA0434 TaxID=3079297 RepID=UPI002905CBDB|nr:TRAP transporter small permease subunit [Roseobacter sp. HKCCA0434]
MTLLTTLLRALVAVNSRLLAAGRFIAWVLIGLMTVVILYQVVMRYVFNAAPNWTEEFARFMMLWMTGLIAPSAYRWGGFVSIDMAVRSLPRVPSLVLTLLLLMLAQTVLTVGAQIGWSEVTGFSGTFKTSSLQTFFFPSLENRTVEFGWAKMPSSHMMASLLVGIWLLFLVNVELMLKTVIRIFDPEADIPPDPAQIVAGAD